MAASNRTQHKKHAIRTKRFRTKTIPASHNLLKSLRCKNPRNDFAEPPHFVQRVRKILIDGVARASVDAQCRMLNQLFPVARSVTFPGLQESETAMAAIVAARFNQGSVTQGNVTPL